MRQKKVTWDSLDPRETIVSRLRSDLPEVFSDGKLDVEKLKSALWEESITEEWGYSFTWTGKKECFNTIQEKTTQTLHPKKEESVEWDNTQNIFIEWDNLEALKILQRSYHGQVKMIYIDPPYNTGNDFIYSDKFAQAKKEALVEMGAINEKGEVINAELYKQNTKDSGHYHSKWLSMMYPRLYLARNLLRDDGVIFVSIDDHEVHNLRKMMDEIFGEENFVWQLIWENREWGWWSDSKLFRVKHEYILWYAKSVSSLLINGVEISNSSRYTQQDKHFKARGPYYLQKLWMGSLGYVASLDFPIPGPDKDIVPNTDGAQINRWRWWKSKVKWGLKNDFIEFKKDSKNEWQVYTKQYLNVDNEGKKIQRTNRPIWVIDKYSSTQATKQLEGLMTSKVFNYPKPVDLLKYLVFLVDYKDDDIVLDFFAWSWTTAHAVMVLNAEDGGKRRCISVQLPESCKEWTEAHKAGYATIADISKERIRRAGKKIAEEHPDSEFDRGFRVFKIWASNFKEWDPHLQDEAQLEQQLLDHLNNIKDEATDESILHELLLKVGQWLIPEVEKHEFWGISYYRAGTDGRLVFCLARKEELTLDLFDEILKTQTDKIFVLDSGFPKNTPLITNAELRCKEAGVMEFIVL